MTGLTRMPLFRTKGKALLLQAPLPLARHLPLLRKPVFVCCVRRSGVSVGQNCIVIEARGPHSLFLHAVYSHTHPYTYKSTQGTMAGAGADDDEGDNKKKGEEEAAWTFVTSSKKGKSGKGKPRSSSSSSTATSASSNQLHTHGLRYVKRQSGMDVQVSIYICV